MWTCARYCEQTRRPGCTGIDIDGAFAVWEQGREAIEGLHLVRDMPNREKVKRCRG